MRLLSRTLLGLDGQCRLVVRRASSSSSHMSAIDAIKAHPPKIIPDYLHPMSSHLLTVTIDDLLRQPTSSSPVISSPPRPLPPGHHLVYFPIQLPPSLLAPDGADPDHSPGAPFTRRLWAGGEVTFHPGARRGLVLDCRPVVCRETIGDVGVRGGKGDDGDKVFVDVWRRYGLGHEDVEARQDWEIEERRTLVFTREQQQAAPSPPRLIKYKYPPSYSISLTPSPTHLFHFSALSFNAHAIHLDPLYARAVDSHRALLVHGPLTLALMLRVLSDRLSLGPSAAAVRRFVYRNHAPLYVDEPMTVSLRRVTEGDGVQGRWDVWVEGPEGGLAVKGTAEVVPVEDSIS